MGKKKQIEAAAEPADEQAAAPAAEEPKAPKAGGKSCDVLDGHGNFIRTYSEQVHGEDFRELAKEFASKEPGRKVC